MGEGWGEGIPRMAAIFPNTLTAQNTSLAACCPLSSSLPRERGRVAVGIKGSARKTGCIGCFFTFQTTCINGCKSKLLFKLPATEKIAVTCSLPRGGGLGRGHSPNSATFPNTLTAPIQAFRLVALSLALSHGERGRGICWN